MLTMKRVEVWQTGKGAASLWEKWPRPGADEYGCFHRAQCVLSVRNWVWAAGLSLRECLWFMRLVCLFV